MKTYYKATRPDGTDFYTGRIKYEVGKTVKPAKAPKARICGPGFLHAADVPAMTLVGGSWPCRLFEVEGDPVVGFDEDHPHKGGFSELLVVREVDAHLALGPNGVEVVELIERAGTITPQQAAAGAAAWDAARDAARDAAWDAARDAAWDAAWAAARAAARALVVRDLISDEHFEILYGPWRKVMG